MQIISNLPYALDTVSTGRVEVVSVSCLPIQACAALSMPQ